MMDLKKFGHLLKTERVSVFNKTTPPTSEIHSKI